MKTTVKVALLICASTSVSSLYAQKEYPKPEPMTPGMTEFWEPQPKIVTPGAPLKDSGTTTAPSDAIILFDGKDLSQWRKGDGTAAEWPVKNGVFIAGKGMIYTKKDFNSYQLHLEWRIPENITGTSQGRGNSGVFMQDKYEVQILDNYNNETYANGQAGSIYKQYAPLVNAMRKPGDWNVYDIIYTAPTFKKDGTYLTNPRITVIHNGVVVQNNTIILGTTEYIGVPKVMTHGPGPIALQDHGNPIAFRNVWVRELE